MPAQSVFKALFTTWGPQHWWPGDTPLEVCVGAILTQNTAWVNVEKAMTNLKQAEALQMQRLHEAPVKQLEQWLREEGGKGSR